MKINTRSIRFRLTGLFVALFSVSLLVLGVGARVLFVQSLQESIDTALYNHTIDITESIEIDRFGDLSVSRDLLTDNNKLFPFSTGRAYIQILWPDGRIVARSAALGELRLPLFLDDWRTLTRRGHAFRTLGLSELPPQPTRFRTSYRMLSYLVNDRLAHNPKSFIVQVAVPMTYLEQSVQGLRTLTGIVVPSTLILATLLGLLFSRSALKPVTAIIEKAKALSPTNLSERIPVPPVDDELRALSLTLNELLGRLQRAFESQERFIADASHELKTPLAILRGELDVLTRRERKPEEVGAFLDSAKQELETLSGIVEDLLVLARVDAGAGSLEMSVVRLDEIALETLARLEPKAKGAGVEVRVNLFGDAFEIHADPGLMRSMAQNLLDNAIKFSPRGGAVDFELRADESGKTLIVRDRGRGIAPDALSRIFDRFYRVEGAVADSPAQPRVPGTGLGLAIVQRIVAAHGGRIEVESRLGEGARFTVHLPTVVPTVAAG